MRVGKVRDRRTAILRQEVQGLTRVKERGGVNATLIGRPTPFSLERTLWAPLEPGDDRPRAGIRREPTAFLVD